MFYKSEIKITEIKIAFILLILSENDVTPG